MSERSTPGRTRVLLVAHNYPLPSETYIETERRFLDRHADTHVFARFGPGPEITPEHGSYTVGSSPREIRRVVRRWSPDVVHAHWASCASQAAAVARVADVPWTMRTHSFDVLTPSHDVLQRVAALANEPDCLGVLGFPFARPLLERAGLHPEKFTETLPVVDIDRFRSNGPHGDSVLSFGALQERKALAAAEFARLSRLVPDARFVHHPLGHGTRSELRAQLASIVAEEGGRVEIRDWVPHGRMPAVFADARWFVYPGPSGVGFGWPLAIAEAWAAGVGVCVQRVRPDIEDYVGDAAVVFDDIEELRDLLGRPPSPAMLARARERAERMDISRHGAALLELWADRTTVGRSPNGLGRS